MKKLLFLLSSILVLTFLMLPTNADAHKRKHKHRKTRVTAVQADSVRVVRAPGVPNQSKLDSIKAAKSKLKHQTFHVVVSFVSRGSGSDGKAVASLEKAMKDFNQKNSNALEFSVKNWGKEGERDYCVVSNNQENLNSFVAKMKKLFENNRLVLIKENEDCKK